MIVANASKEFKDRAPSGWSGGTPYATVNDALVLSTGNGVLSFTDGFMMSNARGLEPSKTEEPGLGDPVDLTLYKNATGAVANPLVINIDRGCKTCLSLKQVMWLPSKNGWLERYQYEGLSEMERISTWFELIPNPAGGFVRRSTSIKRVLARVTLNYDALHSGGLIHYYRPRYLECIEHQ